MSGGSFRWWFDCPYLDFGKHLGLVEHVEIRLKVEFLFFELIDVLVCPIGGLTLMFGVLLIEFTISYDKTRYDRSVRKREKCAELTCT